MVTLRKSRLVCQGRTDLQFLDPRSLKVRTHQLKKKRKKISSLKLKKYLILKTFLKILKMIKNKPPRRMRKLESINT